MSAFTELLGTELLGASASKVSTQEALAGKSAVALYFSAHWCPPCRGFTPQLAEWYKKDLKAKGLEVVFVSSDRDEGAFKEYFAEMPWLALPYAERDLKATLSKKFKVQGIPSLVILGSDGKVITLDGREAVSNDPTGEELPWKPVPLKDVLAKAKLVNASGPVTLSQAVQGKTALALYFSAHWCPPCRGFTPQLAEWYTKSLKDKGLEVIFVSGDRDEASFKEYYAEQPWLALDYGDSKTNKQLNSTLKVEGIPTLVILDQELNVVNKEGRGAVSSDPEGLEMPWHPKPVNNLNAGPGSIEEEPTVVLFCEALSKDEQKALEAAVEPLARKFLDKAKESGDDPEVGFMMATKAGGLAQQIRGMLKLPTEGDAAAKPRLALVDIPDEGGYYVAAEDAPLTAAEVEKFVADYQSKKLERKQLTPS
mmetsp:Transcript_41400/g.74989  ORF Transcript_41400/g.74989 Transcript_41400/m.74989 type:complete len:424 (-) Transcript_41400:124-1395(-)